MLARFLLLAALVIVAIRFFRKLARAIGGRPVPDQTAQRKKSALNLDETQIQDADFTDL